MHDVKMIKGKFKCWNNVIGNVNCNYLKENTYCDSMLLKANHEYNFFWKLRGMSAFHMPHKMYLILNRYYIIQYYIINAILSPSADCIKSSSSQLSFVCVSRNLSAAGLSLEERFCYPGQSKSDFEKIFSKSLLPK